MRMKRVVSILAAAVLVFGLTGCNAITIDGETENASGEMSGNGSIGFSVSTLNNPFFVTLSEGAKEKAKTEGEKLIVVDAGDDAAKQTSDIEDLISKNISVLIVNPVDSDAVAPAVKDAVSRGIKVISVDRGVNGRRLCHCFRQCGRCENGNRIYGITSWRKCKSSRTGGRFRRQCNDRARKRIPFGGR